MLPEYFAFIGAAVASIGGLYYLYETIQGTAKPNRVTWLLWFIFPMIVFVAQLSEGVKGIAWVSFVSGFTPLLIVIASFFNKKSYWKTRPFDYSCMAIGFLGIALWAMTDEANLAILFAIFADFAAAVPTILKAYKHPETESWIAFAVSSLGFFVSMLAIQEWNFENAAFVIYLVSANGLLAILSARKPSKDLLAIEP